MTASSAGFAMVAENQLSAVPFPLRLFEVITLQQSACMHDNATIGK